jgi:hypothetical protein
MNGQQSRTLIALRRIIVAVLTMVGCMAGDTAWAERKVTLAWDGSSDGTIAGFAVYVREENSPELARVDVGGSTQAEISGLKEGLSYTFHVTAYNPLGIESPPSQPISFFVPVPLQLMPPSVAPPGSLRFPAAPGRWYELQASTDLSNWSTIWQTGVANSYSWINFQDPRARYYSSRFYRLQVH